MKISDRNLEEIVAILPSYQQGKGRMTRIWLVDGTEVSDPRQPKRILSRALSAKGISLNEYRQAHANTVYGKHYLPIVYEEMVFVPCKVLSAPIAGDQVYGYVQVRTVQAVLSHGSCGCLILYDGREILTQQAARTVQQNVDRGLGAFARLQQAKQTAQRKDLQTWMEAAVIAETPGITLPAEKIIVQGHVFIAQEKVMAMMDAALSQPAAFVVNTDRGKSSSVHRSPLIW